MKRSTALTLLLSAVLLPVAAIYWSCLPYTTQAGDSAEVVSSSWLLQVLHPPGFPILLWLNHALLRLFQPTSVAHGVAAVNAFYSLCGLALIGWSLRRNFWVATAAMTALASSRIFWRLSVVPEVFSLHWLFVCAFLTVYMEESLGRWERYRLPILALLFGLGASNHQTILFALPMLARQWVVESDRRLRAWSPVVSAAAVFFFYGSFLLMDTKSYGAWGGIESLGDVLFHFRRGDYGTTSLSTMGGLFFYWSILFKFLSNLAFDFMPVMTLGLILIPLARLRKRSRPWPKAWRWLLISFLTYTTVFFSLSNIQPVGFAGDVLERFFIMPLIFLVYLIGHLAVVRWKALEKERWLKAFGVLAIGLSIFNYFNYREINDYSRNTIVEDYARNFLESAAKSRELSKKPGVLVISYDSSYFAMRYLQNVVGFHRELPVVSLPLLRRPWYLKQINENFFPDNPLTYDPELLDRGELVDNYVGGNIDRFDFYYDAHMNRSSDFLITYLPVGRKVSKGSGVAFESLGGFRPVLRSSPEKLNFGIADEYNHYLHIYLDYTFFWMAQGIQAHKKGESAKAVDHFLEALRYSPYAIPAKANICLILARHNDPRTAQCDAELAAFEKTHFNYFPAAAPQKKPEN